MGIDFRRPRHIRGFRLGEVLIFGPGIGRVLVEKTVSGAIAHIEDGADGVPLKNWLVTLPASLTGYTAVNAVKAGKNLFDGYTKGYGVNSSTGAIFTNQNGAISGYIQIKPNTAFYVSGLTDTIHSFVAYYKADKTYISRTNGSNRSYVSATTPSECYYIIVYQYANNDIGTIDDVDNLQTQLEIGSTATAYEAYETPTQYTVSLGRTIYGGTADIVTGEGEATYKGFNLGALTWSGGIIGGQMWCWYVDLSAEGLKLPANSAIFDGISDNYTPIRYNGISSNANTIALRSNGYLYVNNGSDTIQPTGKVSIALDTADAFTFTPITPTPETALGSNNFWADEGDSQVTYYAYAD